MEYIHFRHDRHDNCGIDIETERIFLYDKDGFCAMVKEEIGTSLKNYIQYDGYRIMSHDEWNDITKQMGETFEKWKEQFNKCTDEEERVSMIFDYLNHYKSISLCFTGRYGYRHSFYIGILKPVDGVLL